MMKSVFDVKNRKPFDGDVFERMKKTALELLDAAERGPYTQAVVLLSVRGNEYGAVIQNALSEEKTDERALLARLHRAEDTAIQCVLCMWQDGGIDIPSLAFRRMLCDLNPNNTEALQFVMTTDGVVGIDVFATMK